MKSFLGWQTLVGILIGVAGAILLRQSLLPASEPHGPMLPDCGGSIRGVVLQYAQGSQTVCPVYEAFLTELPASVQTLVLCENEAARRELLGGLSAKLHPRLDIVIADHPMTAWSRDRWFAESASRADGRITIVAPSGENAADVWPARKGDERVSTDLAQFWPKLFRARRSVLAFDAGDFLADGQYAFVSPSVLRRNLQHTARSREQLMRLLASELGRTPVLLDDAPYHHVGMYMMSAGGNRMLVGDPALAKRLLSGEEAALKKLPGGPDWSREMQQKFDSVARAAENAGFEVIRIPCVPSHDKPYITYVNVILDERAGERTVYMPVFDDVEVLNAAAEKVWTDLGWRVCRINCTSVYLHGGTLHCLVNVYARD